MEDYYHYTTPTSAIAILSDRKIIQSSQKATGRDAVYGSGVYLTTTPPTIPKLLIAFNNYDGMSTNAIQKLIATGKVDAYIRLTLREDEVKKCKDKNGRDIFLYPNKDLRIRSRMQPCIGITGR